MPRHEDVSVDPVLLEVVRHQLLAVSEVMNVTLRRTTRSVAARETNDFSSALLDPSGVTILQAVPYGLRVFAHGVPYVVEKFRGRFEPGDVLVTNDPYRGASHLPDLMVVAPIFWQDEHVGFAATYQHHTDIGGRFPGGFGTESRQVYEEGLQLPIVHLYRRGRREESVFDIVRANVRAPDDVIGDLEANVAACRRGAEGFAELLDRYGRDAVRGCVEHYLSFTEERVRDLVDSMPDGRYETKSTYDDGAGTRFDLALALVVDGRNLTVDLTGSSPQQEGAWNIPPGMPVDIICGPLLGLMPHPDLVVNAGLLRAIELVAPPGTIVNPRFPAAVASRAQALTVLADLMFEALALALPDRVPAAGEGGFTVFIFSGRARDGEPPGVLTDLWGGGWGARPASDGIDGVVMLSANGFRTSSGEILELESPIALDGFGFVPDSGGAGRFRGTMSMFRRIRILRDGRVMIRTCRPDSVAPGRDGGSSGGPFSASLLRGGVMHELPRHSVLDIEVLEGDVIEHICPGGGGFGDPRLRAPELVLGDVLDGKITVKGAARDYGLLVDSTEGTVVPLLPQGSS
jgi:N-methylhydantoinase B